MAIKFDDILDAYQSACFGDVTAYLCLRTGTTYLCSSMGDPIDELPDDIDDESKYVQLPDKNELRLGLPLVMDFVEQFMPGDYDAVMDMFRKKGAYRRFRGLLTGRRRLEQWHAFEAEAEAAALRQWCKDVKIEVEG